MKPAAGSDPIGGSDPLLDQSVDHRPRGHRLIARIAVCCGRTRWRALRRCRPSACAGSSDVRNAAVWAIRCRVAPCGLLGPSDPGIALRWC